MKEKLHSLNGLTLNIENNDIVIIKVENSINRTLIKICKKDDKFEIDLENNKELVDYDGLVKFGIKFLPKYLKSIYHKAIMNLYSDI